MNFRHDLSFKFLNVCSFNHEVNIGGSMSGITGPTENTGVGGVGSSSVPSSPNLMPGFTDILDRTTRNFDAIAAEKAAQMEAMNKALAAQKAVQELLNQYTRADPGFPPSFKPAFPVPSSGTEVAAFQAALKSAMDALNDALNAMPRGPDGQPSDMVLYSAISEQRNAINAVLNGPDGKERSLEDLSKAATFILGGIKMTNDPTRPDVPDPNVYPDSKFSNLTGGQYQTREKFQSGLTNGITLTTAANANASSQFQALQTDFTAMMSALASLFASLNSMLLGSARKIAG